MSRAWWSAWFKAWAELGASMRRFRSTQKVSLVFAALATIVNLLASNWPAAFWSCTTLFAWIQCALNDLADREFEAALRGHPETRHLYTDGGEYHVSYENDEDPK